MKSNLYYIFVLFLFLLPSSLFAADFTALVGIPGLDNLSGDGGLNQYINALYRLSISIAALLAVIKIVAAGAKYMLSDIVPSKEQAKKEIQGALIGLLIVIGAVIILNTVNSDLTQLNLKLPDQEIKQAEQFSEIIRQRMLALEDRADELNSKVITLDCENIAGINKFDMQGNEDEEAACKRNCKLLKAEFIDSAPLVADQCKYIESIGKSCDPDSSKMCCESIQDGTWIVAHRRCSTETNPIKVSVCSGFFDDDTDERVCDEEIKDCLESDNDLVSTHINKEGDSVLRSSIMCTDKAQQETNAEASCKGIWNSNTKTCTLAGKTFEISDLSPFYYSTPVGDLPESAIAEANEMCTLQASTKSSIKTGTWVWDGQVCKNQQ